jgi:hypothetical protein
LPLYRRLLGQRFDALPACVRELHEVTATSRWDGRADVERGSGPAARFAGRLLGLPPAGREQPLSVTFEPVEGREVWTRTFGASVFRSVQDEQDGLLRERAGPVTFLFALRRRARGSR